MATKIGKWYITLNNPRELLAHSRMMYDYGYLQEQRIERLNKFLEEKESSLKVDVQYYEKLLRNTEKSSYYYPVYLKTIHKDNACRELIKEISKILNN